jgi:hypothetical protein
VYNMKKIAYTTSIDSVKHTLLLTIANLAVRCVNCLQVQYDTTTVHMKTRELLQIVANVCHR